MGIGCRFPIPHSISVYLCVLFSTTQFFSSVVPKYLHEQESKIQLCITHVVFARVPQQTTIEKNNNGAFSVDYLPFLSFCIFLSLSMLVTINK